MNTVISKGISIFLISLFSSLCFVFLFRAIAIRFSIFDNPDGAIKKHKNPVPYLGGVGVYCGFLLSLLLSGVCIENMTLCLVGSSLLLLLGLLDDLVILNPYQKFAGQLFVVLCFLRAGIYSKEHFFSNYGNLLISGVWVLTIINGFNLVDVMDGLATTIALCATISFMLTAILFHQYDILFFLVAFAGSLIAFFWYNRPNATIYLGDAGSLFVGGVLAVVPFFFTWGKYNVCGYLTPVLFLAVPLLEVVFLILIRSAKGIPFYKGSPDHFCHYLQRRGWSKYAVLGYVMVNSLLAGLLGVLYASGIILFAHMILAVFIGAAVWIITVYLSIFDLS